MLPSKGIPKELKVYERKRCKSKKKCLEEEYLMKLGGKYPKTALE